MSSSLISFSLRDHITEPFIDEERGAGWVRPPRAQLGLGRAGRRPLRSSSWLQRVKQKPQERQTPAWRVRVSRSTCLSRPVDIRGWGGGLLQNPLLLEDERLVSPESAPMGKVALGKTLLPDPPPPRRTAKRGPRALGRGPQGGFEGWLPGTPPGPRASLRGLGEDRRVNA